jgi:RNA12 protein/RNA recognition motif
LELFRQFGRIRDIVPASPSSKEFPRFGIITFVSIHSAAAAKNCIHQVVVDGTKLHISYESVRKPFRFIWDWLITHPRIIIPLAAALFAVVIGTIFDPIRTWAVESKVTRKWHVEDSKLVLWLRRSLNELAPFRRSRRGQQRVWDIDENVAKVMEWIGENQNTLIVVVGPKGTAKREMVIDGVLAGRPKYTPMIWTNDSTLVIDCESVVEQHRDSAVIRQLAQQVGYAPIFNWLNSFSSIVDLAAQGPSPSNLSDAGTIGQKAGFTETLESQVKKILNTTATALKRVALSKKPEPEKGQSPVRDEDFLEVTPLFSATLTQQNPQHRPVIVIDNFLHKADNAGIIYENIAKWASVLVEANIAHVIFLTNDVGYSKALATDRVLRTVTLRDKDAESARVYVLRQLEYIENERKRLKKEQGDTTEAGKKGRDLDLDNCIRVLGGRVKDLEGLAQRLAMGTSPDGSRISTSVLT